MRKIFLLLALLLPAIALATPPILENNLNRDARLDFAKRKGYTGIVGFGDTLYCSVATADTSIIYNLWPTTSLQVEGIAAGNDSCRFLLNVYIGHAQEGTYSKLLKAYTFTINTAGAQLPITLPFTANYFMLETKPLPGNGQDTKARILIYRSAGGATGPMEAYSDTSTRNAPGAFPGSATRGYTSATFAAKVKKLATSVTLRPEGFIRLLNLWAPLDADNDTLVYADSTSAFLRTYAIPSNVDSIRCKWISEAGGTDHAVTSILKLVR